MAKKVYRLHKDKEGSGWFTSTALSQEQISSISAAGMNAKKIATSIPSPFARIDLVKNAFNEISKDGIGIIGNTNDHKLISDALDVAQLFFHFDKVKNKYPNTEIIDWNPTKHIAEMKNIPATNMLGETIDLFWNQDGKSYNFDKLNRLFILKVNHKVIGATSPATLFFAAPDVSEKDIDFQFDSVKLFDSNYESIIERDDSFIGFIYALYKQQSFATNFPEVYEYLKKALNGLKNSKQLLWNKVSGFDSNTLTTDFTQLEIEAGNPIEIIGMPVCKDIPGAINSDFTIKTSLKTGEELPLVLPVDAFHKEWIYMDSPWDSNITVEKKDLNPLGKRTLPGQARQYPYFTIGDFLEDNIIKLPFELNSAGIETFGAREHIVPIKSLLLEYFSIEELKKGMIEIDESIIGGVQVTLNIPTKRGKITYKKTYSDVDSVRERNFQCGLYPSIRVRNRKIKYHVGLIDQDSTPDNTVKFSFWKVGSEIPFDKESVEFRVRKEKTDRGVYQYGINQDFDYISVKTNENVSGILIPKFTKTQSGTGSAIVAIDFGTTNTHVEYKYDRGLSKSFDAEQLYTSLALVGQKLKPKNAVAERILNMELYPVEIGLGKDISFPLRTALIENKTINWGANAYPFLDSNIAYFYENLNSQAHHRVLTDLKWGDMSKVADRKKTQHFLEGLLESISNKLLMDSVDFDNLDLRWLYPVSMTAFQRNGLESIWDAAVDNIFGKINSLESIPESVSPYTFYVNTQGIMGLTASIDIGGGTSDIAIFDTSGAKYISSVNFAGNHVMGDGYNSNILINGFVKAFEKEFIETCQNKDNASELTSIISSIKDGGNASSSNFNSFLFSVDNGIYDYSDQIRNEGKLKFLFILFYAAQAYYLAKSMRALEMEIPKNIIFSGSGSKSLNIIDSKKMNEVTKMVNFIFNKVYNRSDANILIKLEPDPKEITSKGALYANDINVENITGFWTGATKENDKVLFTSDQDVLKYEDIKTKSFTSSILDSTQVFFKVFDEYTSEVNLLNTFGIKPGVIDLFRSTRNDYLDNYLDYGIKEKIKSAQDSKLSISEGLFFYPLVGLINKLGTDLVQI
ncbi:MAG: hypothetical protein ACI93P_002117 [bacterium]|jgi:hypothetical protein